MINNKYVLFIEIPIARDASGRLFCDSFWAKDLKLHLNYISDLSICCPVFEVGANQDIKDVQKLISYNFDVLEEVTSYNFKLIKLNHCLGWWSVFKNLIPNFIRVIRACKGAEIVHSGGAGWPFPSSFYLLFLRPFYSFQWIMVIESTFFMLQKGEKFSLRKFFGHHLHMTLLPLCAKFSDARIFTHKHYKTLFLKSNERVLIANSTWLDSEHLLSENEAQSKLMNANNHPLRLLFAGRLIESKGVFVLFEAINSLNKNGTVVHIDIMGSGDLEAQCKEFAMKNHGTVAVSFKEPVPYGVPFFKNLSNYDALLLPSLSEEQPRIIYDAYGQGLCIIASNTSGLTEVCVDGENAIIFQRGEPQALADAISYGVNNQSKLVQFGLNGLSLAKTKTHQQVHIDREQFLNRVLRIR